MKNFTLLIVFTGIIMISCSGNIPARDVPSIVLNTFKTKFPKAADVEWKNSEALYTAEFEIGNIDHAVQLNSKGNIVIYKKEIGKSELPGGIKALLSNKFKTYFTDEIEAVQREGLAYYQIELESNGKPEKKLVLSADGRENHSITYWD
ncbi:hypothetical protein WG906_00880 [Pedobacter sp. P351]|uniref:hypothetical protein n=1 Tax=Pedobacter superstes TaxID=3133441 RepID=UPI0030B55835